jgi:periplasmic protein CpxP/Spy
MAHAFFSHQPPPLSMEPAMTLTSITSRSAKLVGAGLLAALLGTAALSAWAQPMRDGGHGGHGVHGGGMGMMMGGRGLERMLDSVNATTEQRSQIKAIAERAMADLRAQREAGGSARMQMMSLFAQPVVDANALEALRAQQMQRHDQASRRIAQALLETSRVLTPEQRKQLAERAAKHGEMFERHRRERQQMHGGAPR